MRCDQLAAMARQHLNAQHWTFEVMAMPREGQLRKQRRMTEDVRGAIVIFLKRAWKVVDPAILNTWRDAVGAMAIDYVDARTTPQPTVAIDVHIAASGALERHLTSAHAMARVMRLDHHADPGLSTGTAQNGLRLAYFGRKSNRTLPRPVRHRILEPDYDGGVVAPDIQRAMMQANMHYAVRDMDDQTHRNSFKPFTKGFNAAAVNAHVLVNRQVDDAVDWLGPDYPFLIEDCRADTIAAAIDRAETMVGTSAWQDSLAPLHNLRRASHPKTITAQLQCILETLAP